MRQQIDKITKKTAVGPHFGFDGARQQVIQEDPIFIIEYTEPWEKVQFLKNRFSDYKWDKVELKGERDVVCIATNVVCLDFSTKLFEFDIVDMIDSTFRVYTKNILEEDVTPPTS